MPEPYGVNMIKKVLVGSLASIGALVALYSAIGLFRATIRSGGQPQQATSAVQRPTTQADIPDEPIQTDVNSFLTEYRTDGEAANSKYKGKKVELTGMVTGVFVPSFVTSMRAEQTGGHADAFITMGGPIPKRPEEALFLPGVSAYSKTEALFGQTHFTAALLSLRRGVTVTLLCTCEEGHRASDMGAEEYAGSSNYSVLLDDCLLKNVSKTPPQDQAYTAEASKIYSLMDKNYRDHPGDGEGSNLIPPRLLHNTTLTYPVDALPMGTSGMVTVGATVGIDGKLSNIHIVKSVSPSLDAAALQAFSTNQFEPARNSITNAPVASDVTQNLSFTPPTQPARSPLRPSTDAPAPIARQAPQ